MPRPTAFMNNFNLLIFLTLLISANPAYGQSSIFTYQGRLQNSGTPATGDYDMQFKLFDTQAVGTGTQQGLPIVIPAVPVANGIFTVQLDFGGAVFSGAARFLEIAVKLTTTPTFGPPLDPRQLLTSTPYAVRSLNAATADGLSVACVNCVTTTEIQNVQGSQVTGTIPVASIPAGSGSYIQNGPSQQASSNFNISGNGTAGGTLTANALNATTSVGIGTPPTRARLETRGAIGNTVALFGGEGTGVALVRDYPFIGFNSYFNSGWKAISPGYGGHVGIEQDVGAMTFYVNPTASSADAVVAPVEAMRITQSGNVGIGTPSPANKLSVNGNADFSGNVGIRSITGAPLTLQGGTPQSVSFDVFASNGQELFVIGGNGAGMGTAIIQLVGTTTMHACYSQFGNAFFFGTCSSAAEYVPTRDGGQGFPETADLVSIAPKVPNPYEDTHGPFVVQKATTSCDDNLLGFIVKPDSGADGKKVNEHYLPLAIYGYFPAKITMENGAIKRGDPITSSSKPGYGMKATQACKIVGYALEDADREGKIQVFAHQSEYTTSQVANLQAQVTVLQRENAAVLRENTNRRRENIVVEKENGKLQARLNRLERAVGVLQLASAQKHKHKHVARAPLVNRTSGG